MPHWRIREGRRGASRLGLSPYMSFLSSQIVVNGERPGKLALNTRVMGFIPIAQ